MVSGAWRQVVLNIQNNTNYPLELDGKKATHGRFESDPPASIDHGSTGTFKVNKNDIGSTIGPEGWVKYRITLLNNIHLYLVFTWNHPQGSGKSSYTVYSDPPNCVSYSVRPPQPTGHNQEITLQPFLQNLDRVYDVKNWMGSMAPETSIAALSIPGTHDSVARHGGPAIQTQSMSITQQLELGIRFLDIRLKLVDGIFKGFHGSEDQRITFDEIYSECSTFLHDHPNETVLMSVNQEDSSHPDIFQSTFDALITDDNHPRMRTETTIPILADAKGKVVLLRRYGGSSIGINCTAWPDNKSGWINGETIYVQDYYVVSLAPIAGETDVDKKWSYVESTCAKANEADNKKNLVINFASGAVGAAPIDIARIINQKVNQKFSVLPRGKYGIVVMDFADMFDGSIVPLIIATNTFK